MFSSYLSADDEPTTWYKLRKFFIGLMKGSFLAAKFLQIGSFFYAPIAGLLCAAHDIYDIYALPADAPQRKSKILASLLSCALNIGFSVASFFNYLNPLNLLIVGCASVVPACLQSFYTIDQSETELKHYRSSSTIIISNIQEQHFQNKATTVYKTLKTIACGMIFGGFFCPPLLIAGSILLALFAGLENYDKNNKFRFAKKIANCFSDNKNNDDEEFIIPPEKTDDYLTGSINASPQPSIPDNTLAAQMMRAMTNRKPTPVIPSEARDLPGRSLASLGMTSRLGVPGGLGMTGRPGTTRAIQMSTFKPPASSSGNAQYKTPAPSQRVPASHTR